MIEIDPAADGEFGREFECTETIETGEELPEDTTTGESREPEPLLTVTMGGVGLAGEGGTLLTL